MTIEHTDKTFEDLCLFSSPTRIHNIFCSRCAFVNCALALDQDNLTLRPQVSEVHLKDCSVAGCVVRGAVLDSIIVDGLKTSGLFQLWATVFRHSVFKGKIDRVMFSPFFNPGIESASFEEQV